MAIIFQYLTSLYGVLEVACLVAAIYCLRKDPDKKWRYFIYYLATVVGIELIGTFTKQHKLAGLNHAVYNLLLMIQIFYFILLLTSYNNLRKTKLHYSLLVILIGGMLSEFFFRGNGDYNSYTKFFLCAITTILCCIFFYNLMQRDENIRLITYPPFWIVVGLFGYSFGSAVVFAFYNIISRNKFLGSDLTFKIIINSTSSILYISWVIAFAWRKQPTSQYLRSRY